MNNAANETCATEKPPAGIIPLGRISPGEQLITLDQFMAKHCEKRSKEVRKYRRKALLAAARNRRRGKGSIALPSPAVPHTNGRPKEYFTHDLLSAWPGSIAEGVDLPALLPPSMKPEE